MSKEYVIHCDESTGKGEFFSNFYGGALVRSEHLEIVREKLATKKKALNLLGEIKWDKVTDNYLQKYKDIIDLFFDLVFEDIVKIRIMFTQNMHRAIGLTSEQIEHTYFLLYYQFIKHGFGLRYSNQGPAPIRVRLLLDQLPDNREKAERFRAFVCALEKSAEFRQAKLILSRDDIADIRSHDHDVLQCLDIVLGSMQFKLNNLHKVIPKGARRRGKRTIAKEKLYNHINKRIREIYPNFNIGISTGTQGDITNRWRHSYSHWRLIPKEVEIDFSKTKRKR